MYILDTVKWQLTVLISRESSLKHLVCNVVLTGVCSHGNQHVTQADHIINISNELTTKYSKQPVSLDLGCKYSQLCSAISEVLELSWSLLHLFIEIDSYLLQLTDYINFHLHCTQETLWQNDFAYFVLQY